MLDDEFVFWSGVVNGDAGLVARFDGGIAVLALVVRNGRIVRIDAVANPDKLRRVPSHEA